MMSSTPESMPKMHVATEDQPASGERGGSRPPLVMPRGLIFLAALWLVGAWVVSIGLQTPVHASSASYEPGVRLMLQAVVLGFFIGWPLLRLSQTAPSSPVRYVLLDLVVLLTLMQVVIWLPRLLTNWLVIRTAAIDATVAGWLVLTAAIVAGTGRSNNSIVRTLGMIGCVAVCLLGLIAAWFGLHVTLDRPDLALLGPFMAVRDLTNAGSVPPTADHWRGIVMVWLVAAGAWVAVGVLAVIAHRRSTSG